MKKFYALMLAAIMTLSLVACGGKTETASSDNSNDANASSAEKIEILMTSFDNSATQACQLGYRFADNVARASEGRITINFQPDGTLANETEQYDLIRNNEVQICYFADSFNSQIAAGYSPCIIPFLFKSVEDVEALLESELGDKIDEVIKETGNVYLLGYSRRTPRLLTASKPINTPEDLKGLKVRVPEIKEWVTVWNAMGASCTVVAWTETYSALQTGVVDAQENPIDNIYANKIYEVNKYIMNTEHLNSLNHWCVNVDFWDSLSADDQSLITDAFNEARDWANQELVKNAEKCKEEILADGTVTFIDVDKDAFRAAAADGINKVLATLQPEAREYAEAYMAG